MNTGTKLKKDFLTVYDYGMGGLWTVIRARSKEEITSKFPELIVMDKRPDWMSEEDICYTIAIRDAFDIDDGEPPSWLTTKK